MGYNSQRVIVDDYTAVRNGERVKLIEVRELVEGARRDIRVAVYAEAV